MIVQTVPPKVETGEQRFVLYDVPWESYIAIGNALLNRNVRITYDRGAMEIMTTSYRHERGKLVARLLEILADEMSMDFIGGGAMTFQREDLERGLEPDDCFWIQHEQDMRAKGDFDQENDPPPDLAVEVEVSRSVLDRLSIYAALRVPEVWRWDGQTIHILLLQSDGTSAESSRSLAFPFLPVSELARFVAMWGSQSDGQIRRDFRQWVREQIARGWKQE